MRPLFVLVSTFALVPSFNCLSSSDKRSSTFSQDPEGNLKETVVRSLGSAVGQTQESHFMKHGARAKYSILPASQTGVVSKPVELRATNLGNYDRHNNLITVTDRVTDSNDHISEKKVARRLPRRVRLGLEWLGVFATGFGFWGLKDGCGDYHEGGDAAPGAKCIVAALGTGAPLVIAGDDTWEYISTLTNTGVNVVGQVADIPLENYPIHRLPNGPFFPNMADLPAKRDDSVGRVERAISTKLGMEVRHVGVWDGNHPGSPEKRHDKTEAHPVFAMDRNGQDFHFSYMGRREDTGEHKFIFGYGPGIENQQNKMRLKARQAFTYNTQYFDRGGLDIIGQSDIMGGSNHPEVQPDLNDPNSYQWLYEQMNCYMDGGSYEALRHHGLWFQIYDSNDEGSHPGTLAAGAIAAFGPSTPSAISWMQSSGGIPTVEGCSSIGPWKM
ncbi:uncharacterized protein JN550_011571 [Neoarthrinium moseri]|uniref:uncharacterized protein n=1 Tax=Neoarthrinium moseri TaxID=1658444 RepID=UPI001FDB31E6|nr:uncharacterized protein JN550_011571 [Neoarthrinium moseri]KAI1860305.1 hypothetical protein JN550_011571 [Neoarthrinium moseri]